MTRDLGYEDSQVKIWNHINANVSKDYYYVYQDWWYEKDRLSKPGEIETKRVYSYLGLYRKYSEADMYELIHLLRQTQKQ